MLFLVLANKTKIHITTMTIMEHGIVPRRNVSMVTVYSSPTRQQYIETPYGNGIPNHWHCMQMVYHKGKYESTSVIKIK